MNENIVADIMDGKVSIVGVKTLDELINMRAGEEGKYARPLPDAYIGGQPCWIVPRVNAWIESIN